MDILGFISRWYEIKREKKDYCKSCETYKEQLALANFEKKQLLERVLFVPTKETVNAVEPPPQPIMPRMVPFRIQKQMLEAEDRARAATLRRQEEDRVRAESSIERTNSAPIENKAISIAELEKELGVENASEVS